PEMTPEEAQEAEYWFNLAQTIKRLFPELARKAFESKGTGLYGPALASFQLALWEKIHSKLYSLPEQKHEHQLIPVPVASETADQWHKRIQEKPKELNPSSLNPEPKKSSSDVP